MPYSLFLMFFIVLPVSGMLFALRRSLRRKHLLILAVLAVLGLIYAIPWLNYVVASGVWYYDPKLVLTVPLGYAPLEDYAFFALQIMLTGLIGLWLWRRYYRTEFEHRSGIDQSGE